MKGPVDFIEGDSTTRTYTGGHYSAEGKGVTEMEVTTRTLNVRPRKPFGVSTEFWSKSPKREGLYPLYDRSVLF